MQPAMAPDHLEARAQPEMEGIAETDLRADFGMLCEELSGWRGEVMLDEGPGHQGAAQVTRWSARRRG